MTLQRTFLFLTILLTSFIGCNEDPSIVGMGILPKTDFSTPRTDTIYATLHATEPSVLFTGSLDEVMLGKDDNAGIEAWTLLKFYGWDDSLNGASITSATISLRPMYHFGDSLGTLSFDMFFGTGVWTGDSIVYHDSLFNNPQNYYNPSMPIGSVSIPAMDDTSRIYFNIPITDTATLTKWFVSNSDTNSLNQGLILKPTNSTMIKGFYSFNAVSDSEVLYPELIVQYKTANGDTGTYIHAIGAAKYLSRANPSLIAKLTNQGDSLSYIQNGIAYRSTFHFDSLNKHFPSTVLLHSAYIEVTLNAASSLYNLNRTYLTDSLYTYFALSDTTASASSITLSTAYTNAQNQRVYRFSVNSYVQTWLKNPSLIKKIYVTGVNESLTFDRFALYGSNAALVSERPRLIMTYSPSK